MHKDGPHRLLPTSSIIDGAAARKQTTNSDDDDDGGSKAARSMLISGDLGRSRNNDDHTGLCPVDAAECGSTSCRSDRKQSTESCSKASGSTEHQEQHP